VFPQPARPDPLLSDEDRLAVNRASGLRLDTGRDHLAGERFLLYAAVSRPTDLLVLSWRAADDEGQPAVRSLFVDDVADRFSDAPLGRVRRRTLGAVGWAAEEAPTPREAVLAAAAAGPGERPAPLGPLSREAAAAVVGEDRTISATAIEAWASCPVKWFVERLLRPRELVPDPEALVRGKVAHDVLRDVFEQGGAPTPDTLPDARERLHAALAARLAGQPISVNPERLRSHARRLEADLVRFLEHAARDRSAFRPALFEHDVRADLGPFVLEGRIDRVDVRDGEVVIVDYKGKSATPVRRWVRDGKLQLGLYLLAARQLEELGEPAGGLYQPIGTEDPRPRGALVDGADPGRQVVGTDVLPREELDSVLDDVLAAAEEAVAALRAGALEPRPDTCGWAGGGCSYLTICRSE